MCSKISHNNNCYKYQILLLVNKTKNDEEKLKLGADIIVIIIVHYCSKLEEAKTKRKINKLSSNK